MRGDGRALDVLVLAQALIFPQFAPQPHVAINLQAVPDALIADGRRVEIAQATFPRRIREVGRLQEEHVGSRGVVEAARNAHVVEVVPKLRQTHPRRGVPGQHLVRPVPLPIDRPVVRRLAEPGLIHRNRATHTLLDDRLELRVGAASGRVELRRGVGAPRRSADEAPATPTLEHFGAPAHLVRSDAVCRC